MTNYFPHYFTACEKYPIKKVFRLHIFLFLLAIVALSASISAVAGPSSAIAQSTVVPEECKNDLGNPVVPLDGENAWAIILNFNHTKSATETIACWAVVETMEPEKHVVYTGDIRCHLINNVNGIEVGDGQAYFDGNIQIVCPRRVYDHNEEDTYDKFYVQARASFPEAAANYTIINHRDLRVSTTLTPAEEAGKWNAQLSSRYGTTTFEDSKVVEVNPSSRVVFRSTIRDRLGTHEINGEPFEEMREVEGFDFDFNHRIHIGGRIDGDSPGWVLHNLIVDPPPPNIGL